MSKIILRILTLYFLQFLAFIICKSVYSIPGDVDGNGHVEINDAVLIAQYRAGLIPSLPNPADADVNGDGKIDIIDALYISQAADGLTPPEITQINSNTYNDTDNHYPVTSFITINVKQKNPAVELTSATIHITSDSQRFDSGVKNLTQSKDGSYFFFNWNTRTLNMADDYGASVTLTDRFGQSDSAQLNISLGLNPPVPKQLVNVMDVWVPGRGVDTTVSRIYNVLSKDNGPLGYKWTFNYLMHIVEYDDGLVKLVNWDLSPIYFEKNPDGTYKRYPSDFRILTKNPDGTFGLKTKYFGI